MLAVSRALGRFSAISLVGGALGVLIAGCGADGPTLVRDAVEDVPLSDTQPALAAQLRGGDDLSGDQPRFTAFANGDVVKYWVLPGDSRLPGRAYQLCETLERGVCVPAEHPLVLDTLPGEAGYTPYVEVFRVALRRSGRGRQFPSFDAVDEGLRRGMLEAPVRSGRYTHVAVVGDDVRLEVDDGAYASPTRLYARGFRVPVFDFNAAHGTALLEAGQVPFRNVYVLRRSGDAQAISEPIRAADLSGDGDQLDSSNVFGVDLLDGDYTPLWQVVEVEVDDAYQGIDTLLDETQSDYRDAHDMFDVDAADYSITPIPGAIVGHLETGVLLNCPLQSEPGRL
jgi:hypothetical protein